MKRMNEEQLLHLGRYLIPSGDPRYTLIIQDKTCLGTTQLSLQKAELINQSSIPKRNTIYPLHQLLPLPAPQVTHTDGTGSMGHSHKNVKVSHHWLEAAPVNPINQLQKQRDDAASGLTVVPATAYQAQGTENTQQPNDLMTGWKHITQYLMSLFPHLSNTEGRHSFSLK